MADDSPYGIDDLAALGGVSRRTVRYYIQEGLLPPPLGVGRGRHYDRSHLERLLEVRAMQDAGASLDAIRIAVASGDPRRPDSPEVVPLMDRTVWRRLAVAPGVEVHVSGEVSLPAPSKLQELAAWCRTNFRAADASARAERRGGPLRGREDENRGA
jgi:DNA-binding transcriptional MerR regulator